VAGFSVGKHPNESYYAAESSEMEFHPNCYNIAYIGTENKLWKTTDGGASYNLVHTFGTSAGNQIKYIEISSSNPDVMYLNQQPASGNIGTLWKTSDGGATWTALTIPSGNSRRMLLTIDPSDSQRIWIAYPGGSNGNKIYKSADGGLTWSNITTAMLNNEQAQSVFHVAGTNGGIYYCTNKAVYYRNNQMSDWVLENDQLPTFTSTTSARPFYRDYKVRIATYGKGIWESEFYEIPFFPIARIQVDKLSQTVICQTDSFYFDDHSFLNHAGASWNWTFQNGSPSTSTLRNPAVFFNSPGQHMVTLTITDGGGMQDIDTIYVEVINFNAPAIISESFEGSFLPSGWDIYNQDNGGQWSVATGSGSGGTARSALFDNYNIDSQASWDELRTFVNTVGLQLPQLTFDVAYARYGGIYSDTLEVLVSADCGQTFTSLYIKGGNTLATAPNNQNFFTPTPSQWRTDTVSLAGFENEPLLMVAFRNRGHWGNCVYIDGVNINTTTSLTEQPSGQQVFTVFPNPAPAGSCVNFLLPEDTYTVTLYDIRGKKLSSASTGGSGSIDIPASIPGGNYILNFKGSTRIYNKIVTVK
jgi:hypothetical protein